MVERRHKHEPDRRVQHPYGRRRGQRLERYFQRAALVTLIVLVFIGFRLQGEQTNRINQNRAEISRQSCQSQNETKRAIRKLIVDGAKGSRIFEEIYVEYGAPSYPERVQLARQQARTLPYLDCDEFVKKVKEAAE